MTKIIGNRFISILFFAMVLMLISKPASAVILDPTDDAYYTGDKKGLDPSSIAKTGNLELLKFNISSLNKKTQTVTLIKLKLYLDSSLKHPYIDAYYVSDDNWQENSRHMTISLPNMEDPHVSGSIFSDSKGTQWITWDLTSLNLTELTNSDNIISIALKEVNKFNHDKYELILDTAPPAPPVPEPSSSILLLIYAGSGILYLNKLKIWHIKRG